MKIYFFLFSFVFTTTVTFSQNILVVNDNDYITYNTDTLYLGLDNSVYSSYDVWSIPDSAGVGPTAAFMDNYDLVIWYCSTDGLGLKVWDGTTSGNSEIVSFITTGKPIWIIGQDILYQMYTAGTSFTSGDFAYDYLGLASYDNQSYADDGSIGVSQVDKLPGAPAYFPDSLNWIFATNWYVDGCTANAGVIEMYEMGPSSYSLAGNVSMFHNNLVGYSIMSSFFDPALINTRANRIDFLESSIQYLLSFSSIEDNYGFSSIDIYPNPATDRINIVRKNGENFSAVKISSATGQIVLQMPLTAIQNRTEIDLSGLQAGIYFVSIEVNGIVEKPQSVIVKR